MEWLADPQIWMAFFTLLALEIVLGIDNVVFIAILSNKLPAHQQKKARTMGLGLALITRILLLFCLTWVMGLTATLFSLLGQDISGRDLILIIGGLFLIAKSTHEIHNKLEGGGEHDTKVEHPSFGSVLFQILLLDIVFSLDSVITAVGMVDQIQIMIAAVVIAVLFMLAFAGTISAFVERHPTVKMLALSFLLLIGVTLIADGLEQHIPKGYIYFSMAFSVFVEMLNLRMKKTTREPVVLHKPFTVPDTKT